MNDSTTSGASTYRTPWRHRLGEWILLGITVPLLLVLLLFLLTILWMLLTHGLGLLDEDLLAPLQLGSFSLAVALVVWVGRTHFWWTLRLHDDRLELGSPALGGVVVAYETVTFLRQERSAPRQPTRAYATSIRIESDSFRPLRFWAAKPEADACFERLLTLCPRAAGIDLEGREYEPGLTLAVAPGRQRLAQARFVTGAGLVVTGLFLCFQGIAYGVARSRDGLDPLVLLGLWPLYSGALLVVAGLATWRRGWRRRPEPE